MSVWTTDSVIASIGIDCNAINVLAVKEIFFKGSKVIKPLTMNTPVSAMVDSQIRWRMTRYITYLFIVHK